MLRDKASRIRDLAALGVPRHEIARDVGTSTHYVRIVVQQRWDGSSVHDKKYASRDSVKRREAARLRRLYNAVPKRERLRIRAEFCARVRAMGGIVTRAVHAAVALEIRRRGAEILAGANVEKESGTAAGAGAPGG